MQFMQRIHSGDIVFSLAESFIPVGQLFRHLLQPAQLLFILIVNRLRGLNRVCAAPKGHKYLQKNRGIIMDAKKIGTSIAENSLGKLSKARHGDSSAITAPKPSMDIIKRDRSIGYFINKGLWPLFIFLCLGKFNLMQIQAPKSCRAPRGQSHPQRNLPPRTDIASIAKVSAILLLMPSNS